MALLVEVCDWDICETFWFCCEALLRLYLSKEMIFVVSMLGSNLHEEGWRSKNGMLRFAILMSSNLL